MTGCRQTPAVNSLVRDGRGHIANFKNQRHHEKTTLYTTGHFFILGVVSCSTESTPVYQFTGSANPAEAGTVTPSEGEYDEGTEVEIRASANEHWVFTGWQGDHTGSQNPDTVIITADHSVTAMFEKKEYPLTVNTEGSGTVYEQVVQAKATYYPHGTSVELTAAAEHGWHFIEWDGAISGSENPAVVQIDGETTVTAYFSRNDYSVDFSSDGEGSISRELLSGTETEAGYLFESEVELTAVSDEGWEFVEWQGDIESRQNPVQLFMDSDKTIRAVFEPIEYELNISLNGSGNVIQSPDNETYLFNEEVELTAEAASGWEFSGWSGDLEGDENPAAIRMTSDKNITANFNELCLEPEECVNTQFYASVIVGSYIFESRLSISNSLPDPILLTRIRIRRGDGGFAADSENIDREIVPGSGLNFTADYLPQPTTDQFQQFTAEFFIEHRGRSYVLKNKGSISSFKTSVTDKEDNRSVNDSPGIRLLDE